MPIGIITSLEDKIDIIDDKIDAVGLEVGEIEHHLHNYERWYGISADQSGDNWAEEDGLNPYIATSALGDFGTAIKIFGPDDTPNQAGKTKFDTHRIIITSLSVNTLYYLRLIPDVDNDNNADVAEGKGYYTDNPMITVDTNTNRAGGFPSAIIDKRLLAARRVWAKIKNASNGATASFYPGIHEYDV